MRTVLDWILSLLAALVIATVVHVILFVPTMVSGDSMYPTLHNGQILIVEKVSHVFRSAPEYNQIVIIDSRVNRTRSWKDDILEPLSNYYTLFSRISDEHNFWIKRVIGKAGDKLEFKDGMVYRNGEALNEPYIFEPMTYQAAPYVVPENTVWVMGDNRNNSADSRFIGPVPIDHILGHVIIQF